MKNIIKSFPLGWKEYVTDLMIKYPALDILSDKMFLNLDLHFGLLIKFFSQHGIEIERNSGEDYNSPMLYHVVVNRKCMGCFEFLKEAVKESFELFEKQLENKNE